VDHVRGAFEQNFVSLQETLRRVVRKAIEDPTFATTFDTDGDIAKRWPAQLRRNGRTGVI
jgi:hypothetical protein